MNDGGFPEGFYSRTVTTRVPDGGPRNLPESGELHPLVSELQ